MERAAGRGRDDLPARLRAAGPGDAERLSLVGRATFLETFAGVLDGGGLVKHCAQRHAAHVYRAWLEDGISRLWLVEADQGGAPVGYAVLSTPDLPIQLHDADVELKRIYLLGRTQGAGWGRRLMDAIVAQAREDGRRRVLLGVYAKNAAAIAFYRRAGFIQVGERRFQVGDGVYDDVVLALDL